jgi:Concanavalin A-like lectin/glucanases superfamily
MPGFAPISSRLISAQPHQALYVLSTASITIITSGIDTLYAATIPFITRVGDIPANQPFEGTLEPTLRIDRSIVTSEGYGGFAENVSELSLINVDGFYDGIVDLISVNGQAIRCSIGEVTGRSIVAAYQTFELIMNLTGERIRMERNHVVIEMRDPALTLQTETVQQRIYAGTGGIEGGTEIAGKRRPFGDGVVFNATPTLVIAAELLFQFNAGPVASVQAVKDGGVQLTFFADYSTVSVLRQATGGNDSFTKILLHGDGADASTTFTDSNVGGSAHTWTAAGNAQIDTAQSKFGGASMLFDGTGDWITTPDHADFALGSGDWTIDGFFNVAGGAGTFRWLCGQGDGTINANRGVMIFLNGSNNITGAVHIGGVENGINSTTAFTTTGWHHVALVRTGNTLKLFIDGVQEGGNTTISGSINHPATVFGVGVEGSVAGSSWNGWIDEFRLSVGVARWTQNFTPPSVAFATSLQPGFYSTCIAEGYFLLGGVGFKTITVDFTGLRLTTADIIENVALTSAGLTISDIDTSSFIDLNNSQPANVGYYLDSESSETCAEMFTKLMRGIGGWHGMTPLGKLQVRRFERPTGIASTFYDTSGGNIVEIDRVALPQGVDPPPHRWRMIYGRNWTVMTDLFGQVSQNDPAMADYLMSPYKLASTSESQSMQVLAEWPNAPDPNPIESYFALVIDAQNEANRLFQLYTIGLTAYRFTLKNALFVHEIGEIINVTDSRLSLDTGRYVRIVQLSDDVSSMTTEVIGFG